MKTEDLIERLGRELQPVRRLASPGRRAAIWLACAVIYITVVFAQAMLRHSVGATADLPYVVQQGALAVAGIAAAVAAFRSVIPGCQSSVAIRIAIIAAMVMMAALGWDAVRDVQSTGTLGVGRETDWPCVISITLGGGALWAVGVAMLRQGAPLTPVATSVLAAVAALSLANLEACLSRAHTFAATVLIWHGATALVLLAVFVGVGPSIFRWRPAQSPTAT